MSIESTLTRELNIRFIDARSIATQARLNLGINGYPSKEQEALIICDAIQIFQQQPSIVQDQMMQLKSELDSAKASSSCGSDDDSLLMTRSDASSDSQSSNKKSSNSWLKKKTKSLFKSTVSDI